MRARDLSISLLLGLALAAPVHGAAILTREFRFGPEQVVLANRDGRTEVRWAGTASASRPGQPDLPVVGERVEIPSDQRIARIEIVALETAPLADDVTVAATPEWSADRQAIVPGALDAKVADSAGPLPASPASLGYQGFERGRRVAWVMVAPVRWYPAARRLERITRIEVRLVLESSEEQPLARERVVPEWEEDGASPTLSARMARPTAAFEPRIAQPLRATQLPSLLGTPVAYVIVTDDSLAADFQPLADWKSQSGLPAEVRTLSFIRTQYPTGTDDPERIRMFIRDAYTRWGTRWVLLGGDTDLIPPRLAHMTFLGDEQIPSDLYYSCLDGNWDADGDSTWADGYNSPDDPGDNADLLPEVWVGRAPVMSRVDVQRFVQKTLLYEKTPVSDYMTNMLFFAQVLFPDPWTPGHQVQLDGAQLVEKDLLPILDTTPWMHAVRLYQNYTDSRWRPGSLPESKAVVLDSLQRGYNFAVHIGHGYREVMSCGDDNLTNNDMSGLTNGNRLMNCYAVDCTSNAIDFASIGEALMRSPTGGAVTNIGSTTLDFPTFVRAYQKEYFRVMFKDSVTSVGEAQGRQKLPFVGNSFYEGFDRLSQVSLLVLGDPQLRIFTNTPRELTVTAPDSVPASDSSFTVHVEISGVPLFGARVTAWMPGHEYRTGLTDGAGDVVLPFHPDGLGACTLTATAFNARPWQGSMPVVAGAPAALQIRPLTIVDDEHDGRHGNGNASPDAGEQIDLLVPLANAGGTTAADVAGTLSTGDTAVTILAPTATYGSIDPGVTAPPSAGYRVHVSFACPDQREVPFTLDVVDADLHHSQQTFRLLIHAPELMQVSHDESEQGGDDDGRPEPGETVTYVLHFRNLGTGEVRGLSGILGNIDGLATVLDSAFTVPDLGPGAEAVSTPVRFVPSGSDAALTLHVENGDGPLLDRTLLLDYPGAVAGLLAVGGEACVHLAWGHGSDPRLAGYNVYRSSSALGPLSKVTSSPAGPTSIWADVGLSPLTLYFYRVTAVDSSGNESSLSPVVSATTNPALHPGFPAFTRESSTSPVAVEHVYAAYPRDILVGGQVLHLFHPDGTAPVDADGLVATPGDLSTVGRYYTGGGSITDLDGDGGRDMVGAAWTSKQLMVSDTQGNTRPGFPVQINDSMWSGVAVGDLDGDGHKEMVFGSLGTALYAFRSNGAEWLDGDSNPTTLGVFKVMGSSFNPGTPALADLLGNGHKEIIYGSFDGFLYAWQPDGSNAPGFPVNLGASVSGSVAVGRLDGPLGPLSIVVPTVDSRLRVRLADGTNRAGFPVVVATNGTSRSPSPALADMNGDGFLDIVVASTDGRVIVYDRNGAILPPWTASRFSPLTSSATEASPVVADINGDGQNDVVIGDENGSLAALSGADGAMLPGFPIQLDAEASGTAALCDCDGDGMSEIVAVDYGGTVRMWDYDHPFSPGGTPPWPQFHHDAERTGSTDTHALVDVEPAASAVPLALELALPRPNPARSGTRLEFGVPADQAGARLRVVIYDLAGRTVRTLLDGSAHPGHGSAVWDTRDAFGAPAPRGVYLARLSVGALTMTRKVVVLR